jgi:TRAP transporter TAXI family solute receptor
MKGGLAMRKKTRLLVDKYVFVIFAMLAFTAGSFTLLTAKAQARENYTIEIYAIKMGYSGYVLSFGLSDMINKHSEWLRANCIETKGSVENALTLIKHPEKQKTWVAFYNNFTQYMAEKGITPFRKPYDEIRGLCMVTQVCAALGTLDPDIKTLHDLAGKRVMMPPKAIAQGFAYDEILKSVGIYDKIKISRGGLAASKNALIDGTVDVGWVSTNPVRLKPDGTWDFLNVPAPGELFKTKKTYIIEFPEEVLKKAAKETGSPLWHIRNAAGTVGKTTFGPWSGFLVTTGWYVHKDMPGEVVTEIMRVIWEHADEFKSFHAVGATISHENMPRLAEKESLFHPSAVKWYREHGIKKIGLE